MIQASPNFKSEQKNKAILSAAVKIFARDGYEKTDLQVIADLAGVGKGTVYRYFGNKEQLFWAASMDCLSRLQSHIDGHVLKRLSGSKALRSEEVADFLLLIACAGAEFCQSNPAELDVIIQGRGAFHGTTPELQEAFQAHHQQRIDEVVQVISTLTGSKTIVGWDVEAVCTAFFDALLGSLISGYAGGEQQNLVRRVERTMKILLQGMAIRPPSALSKNAPRHQWAGVK